MNNPLIYFSTVIFFLSTFFILKCNFNPDIPRDFDYKGKLLYIEDIDGYGGLYDKEFGDIVILNPGNKKKYFITKDKYFNTSPSWSSKNKNIIFESKRDRGIERFGLTSPSHIYEMNLYTNSIIQFDKYFKNLSKNYSPAYNSKGNKIAFTSYNNYKSKNLIVYEIENDSIYILQENINRLKNIKWSENDKFIIYNCKIIKERINADLAIGILNLTTKEVNYITQKTWIYNVGMVKNNLLIYSGYNKNHEKKDNKSSYIYSYDLQTKKKEIVYSYEYPFLITDVQLSSQNLIYFIRIEFISSGKIKNDIYSLNIETKKLTQITNDGHIKSCLCILD